MLQDPKGVLRDDILPDGTKVRAGDMVTYVPYSMGRMEYNWGQDAASFRPERWLKDGIFQNASPFKFTAFQVCTNKPLHGLYIHDENWVLYSRLDYVVICFFTNSQAGPRICLGKDSAYLQMKMALAILCKFYKFTLVPGHPVKYRMMTILSMAHGLKVNVERRR